MSDSVGAEFWVGKLFFADGTFGTDRSDRAGVFCSSNVFMVALSGALWRAFLAKKPRGLEGNVGEGVLEVLFQVGWGGRLKPELHTPNWKSASSRFRSLSILLPCRTCGGKGRGFLALRGV